MANIRDLLPEVKTHLDSVPDVTALTYLRRAAKQFCQDTGIWTIRTEPVVVQQSDLPIDTDLPFTGTLPSDDFPVDETFPRVVFAIEDVIINTYSSINREAQANPFSYDVITKEFEINRDLFSMYPANVEFVVQLQPTKTADTIPDFLVELRSEGIASYALAELMSMPNRQWSDPRLSVLYMSKYQNRASEARTRKSRQGTTGPIPIDFLPFGG